MGSYGSTIITQSYSELSVTMLLPEASTHTAASPSMNHCRCTSSPAAAARAVLLLETVFSSPQSQGQPSQPTSQLPTCQSLQHLASVQWSQLHATRLLSSRVIGYALLDGRQRRRAHSGTFLLHRCPCYYYRTPGSCDPLLRTALIFTKTLSRVAVNSRPHYRARPPLQEPP